MELSFIITSTREPRACRSQRLPKNFIVHHPLKNNLPLKDKCSVPHIPKNRHPVHRHRDLHSVILPLRNNLTLRRNPKNLLLRNQLHVHRLGKGPLPKHTFQTYERNIMGSAVGLSNYILIAVSVAIVWSQRDKFASNIAWSVGERRKCEPFSHSRMLVKFPQSEFILDIAPVNANELIGRYIFFLPEMYLKQWWRLISES
jgi:hypothetical protein